MAASVDIANMALGHLAAGVEIASITERSPEASACRRFYDTARRAVLRDFPWPFATRLVALALIEEDPNDEWGFSYRVPPDCLFARRIPSGIRNDSHDTRVPYRIIGDDVGELILCDFEDAYLEYTSNVENVDRFAPDFSLALSYRLAAYVSPRLTGGDPRKLGTSAMNMYQYELQSARKNALNEEQPDIEPLPDSVRARS